MTVGDSLVRFALFGAGHSLSNVLPCTVQPIRVELSSRVLARAEAAELCSRLELTLELLDPVQTVNAVLAEVRKGDLA